MEKLQELISRLDFEIENSNPNIKYFELKGALNELRAYVDSLSQPVEVENIVEEIKEETTEEIIEESKPKRGRKSK